MFKRIAGTKDILPVDVFWWQKIEEASRTIFSTYNYQEIRPPIIEQASLFNRSLGEFTEVVQKQMFLIKNQKETYALRPEATASIVRAYIENNLDKISGFSKLYYIGPMFRLERPQKGRLRQFHHIGAEAIGSTGAQIDIEMIFLVRHLLTTYVVEGYEIKINSLGCVKDKGELTRILHKGLGGKLKQLCADCRARFKHNILRILDCKNEACRRLVAELHLGDNHLCPECKEHFNQVKQGLDDLNVAYKIFPHLVRGLDYYSRTVFEITHPELGAQDALCAGGRYDSLIKQLGGQDLGAIGFAFGVERLALVSGLKTLTPPKQKMVYLISLGQQAKRQGSRILAKLRQANITCDTNYAGKSLKGAMRSANDLGAEWVLILGDDELKKNVITLKSMTSGEQRELSPGNLIRELKC